MGSSFIHSDGTNHKLNYSVENGVRLKYTESSTYSSGLVGVRYVGYFNDDLNWFSSATPHGDTNILTQIDGFSSSFDYSQDELYSWEWNGYFKPSSSEIYTFYTSSDDASYLYIDNILVVNNGGLHGNNESSGTINLIADTYYPIKIQFGENTGGDIITVSFSSYTISKTTDGNGYYYHT
jgi:fibro-slime domain-containing protein